jgi:pyridoxal phosphate enzyme (YggS family)
LNRICEEVGRDQLPVLVQIDLAQESTKTGANEAALAEVVKTVAECSHLQLKGLMTLPPFFDDAEKARPYFRHLRMLRDTLKEQGAFGEGPGELSMGMTNDFGVAIEEGATFVRVGTAIFGQRQVLAKSDEGA